MAKLGINTTPPLGTPLPDGGGNINSNFDELYTLLGDGNELYPGIVTSITAGSNISISTSYGNVSIAVSSTAFTETLDSVTDRGNVTSNDIRVGVLTASAFVKSGGTASQFLKADGTVDNNTYLTSSSPISLTLDEVTTNGNTTANNISVGGLAALGNIAAGASIVAVNAAIASSFRRIGGSANEFLKGDGSVDTLTNVGIGTSAGVEALIVNGDARILGVLTVGSASITIDGDAETISVGSTVSIGNSGITIGTGVTITEEGITIQGKPVIDRWTIDGVGISTTANVGIGNSADPSRQLKVDGSTELYELRVSKEGEGIRVTQTGGIDNDGDNFHIWATQDLFLEAGGAGTGTGRGIRILNDSDSVYIDHDLEVDHDVVVGGGVSAVGVVTASFFEGDGSRITNIAGAGDTTGLASEVYVDTAVGLATAGLASIAYVDTEIANIGTADTAGLASIAYVDQEIANIGTADTAGLASIAYVDEQVLGVSTAGLASIVYVDEQVGLATAGLASISYVDQEIANIGTADTAGLASIVYVDNLVAISTAGLGTGSGSIPTLEQVTGAGNVTADSIEADSFVKTGGTFNEFLKADGSLDGSVYATEDLISVDYLQTIGIASIAYVDQEIAGVGGGNTADVRTNSLEVSGVSTFNSPIETNSGIIRPANPGVGLQLNANDNTKLIQGVQFAGSAGAVELYGYNSKKLETNVSGVVVSGVLTATSFSGDGSGLTNINADSADQVKTQSDATNANQYLTFVDSNNVAAGNESLKTDGQLKFNPSTNVLQLDGVVSTTYLTLDSINVNSTATELNYLDGSTPGSATANNAVVLDGNGDISGLGSVTAAYFVGDGSGLTNIGVSTVTDALVELSGVPAGSVGLGTFEKGIITDNVGIKSALQDLELSSAQTATAAKINNYIWSNNNDNTISESQITTDAADWADAIKIYVHRMAKNNVDMQNVFNNTLVRGAKVYIQKTNDATKAFTAHISSDSPIVTGTGTDQVFEYSVIDVSTTGTVFNDSISVNFGIYVDTNTYQVGLATAGLASTEYVNNAISGISTRPHPGTRYTYNSTISSVSDIDNLANGQFWIEEVGGNFSIWVADTDANGITQFGNISASFSHTYNPKQIFSIRDHYNGQVVRHGQFDGISVSTQASGKKIMFSCGSSSTNVFLNAGGSLQNTDSYSLDITGWL